MVSGREMTPIIGVFEDAVLRYLFRVVRVMTPTDWVLTFSSVGVLFAVSLPSCFGWHLSLVVLLSLLAHRHNSQV